MIHWQPTGRQTQEGREAEGERDRAQAVNRPLWMEWLCAAAAAVFAAAAAASNG